MLLLFDVDIYCICVKIHTLTLFLFNLYFYYTLLTKINISENSRPFVFESFYVFRCFEIFFVPTLIVFQFFHQWTTLLPHVSLLTIFFFSEDLKTVTVTKCNSNHITDILTQKNFNLDMLKRYTRKNKLVI